MPSDHLNEPTLQQCWAKTNTATGNPQLTVQDHCIHVGAVTEHIISILPDLTSTYLPQGAATLAALHDIGKITLGFQKKCPQWKFFQNIHNAGLEGNHAKVSHSFLGDFITHKYPAQWAISLGGHHGRYNRDQRRIRFTEQEKEWAQALREELAQKLIQLFGKLPESLEKPSPYQIHWFTGLITFADWIGSNEDFFPLPASKELKNHTTLDDARKKAQAALKHIQWNKVISRNNQSFSQLFPFTPNPLQETLIDACNAPGLYIVEATMGMGKTEAALAAAYQRWQTGEERGIYFALPTQLTSNRIYERISPFLEKAIDSTSPLSLIHGSSWLNDERAMLIQASNTSDNSAAFANDAIKWFSSSRRALLAPFGVGTIDQALLSVLKTKYASLRFFGLAGKTVILDEVHSYDAYTFDLICKLTKELTSAGSSVIVLSATLTQEARQQLVAAAGGCEESEQTSYPLITAVKQQNNFTTTSHYPVTNQEAPKKYHLRHILLPNDCDQDLPTIEDAAQAAKDGACVLIIRNTVKSAQDTYTKIKSLSPEHIPVGLLHSRFPHRRRQEIETCWVGKLEKNSSTRPNGCILVATQVVEQSVDIDADLLITDLAPTDLILQRLGRLHRHDRKRPTGYEEPHCWILHPTITKASDAKVLKKQLGSSAWIYPPYTLLRSADIWSQRETIFLPTDIRSVLEETLAPAEQPTPAALELQEIQIADLQKKINTSRTRSNNPLSSLGLNDDEQGNQTRWGSQRSATLVMLSCSPTISGDTITVQFLSGETHTFNPYQFDYPLAKLLHRNAVRIPAYLVQGGSHGPDWLSSYFFESCTIAIPEHGTGGACELPELTSPINYSIHYNQDSGISFEKTFESSSFDEEDEECWW